jgi:hypothetical protein
MSIWGLVKVLSMFFTPKTVLLRYNDLNDQEVMIIKTQPLVERAGKTYETYVWGMAQSNVRDDSSSSILLPPEWTNARHVSRQNTTIPVVLDKTRVMDVYVYGSWQPEFDSLRREKGNIIRFMSESGQENEDADVTVITEHANKTKNPELRPPTQYTYDVVLVNGVQIKGVHPKRLYILREKNKKVVDDDDDPFDEV